MDFEFIAFFLLLGLVLIPIFTFFSVLSLRRRVHALEKTIGQLSTSATTQDVTKSHIETKADVTHEPEISMKQTTATVSQHVSREPDWQDAFGAWLKEDWLLKAGAALLLIGFGWFVSYAFIQNWIGPIGRISLCMSVGIAILIFGFFRLQKYLHQGSIFLVLGSTTILLTIFAARGIYGFFTPVSALAIMFATVAFVAYASVVYNNRALALISIILAGIAPVLTNPSSNDVGLFVYLFIVTLGTVWIVLLTNRRELLVAGLCLITIYSLPHFSGYNNSASHILLYIAFGFSALFFGVNTIGLLHSKETETKSDLITAVGNAFFLLVWIITVVHKDWQSLIIAAWTVAFSVGAFLLYKITNRREPFYIYTGISIGLLGAATAAELQGPALTIAFTFEIVALIVLATTVLKNTSLAQKLCLLLVLPILRSIDSIDSYNWQNGFLHSDFLVLSIVMIACAVVSIVFFKENKIHANTVIQKYSETLAVIASLYVYTLIWLSLHAGKFSYTMEQQYSIATTISLTIYIITGISAYMYSIHHGLPGLKKYGSIMIGCVIARLLLIDIWNMELASRIIVFIIIGSLLMSTAFLGKKQSSLRN